MLVMTFVTSFSAKLLLTADPFGFGIVDSEVLAKDILHRQFALQGQAVVLPCHQRQKKKMTDVRTKMRENDSFAHNALHTG